MPLSVKSKSAILSDLITNVLANPNSSALGLTDITPASVLRTLLEAQANTIAEQFFQLFAFRESFYLSTATDTDLDRRGTDLGRRRDAGQPASGTVIWTRDPLATEDVPLPQPQGLLARKADGTILRYRSVASAILTPQGRSVSSGTPGTSTTSGTIEGLTVNLDGDGPQAIALGTQAGGPAVALAIQTAVRALTAITPANQPAYSLFRADYSVTSPGVYTLRSGTTGPLSSVVITPGAAADASTTLLLGVLSGGVETPGQDTLTLTAISDTIGLVGNIAAGQITSQAAPVAGILSVSNPVIFANGRDPASDEAYRQDVRSYLLSLGRGTSDALERATLLVANSDGHRVVQSAEVLADGGNVVIHITDGQSQTVGAQPTTIALVQNELDGNGLQPGGWLPSGSTLVVNPARLQTVPVNLTALLTPGTANLVSVQEGIIQAITNYFLALSIGAPVRFIAMLAAIELAVGGILQTTFTAPAHFTLFEDVPGIIHTKFILGALQVRVIRQPI